MSDVDTLNHINLSTLKEIVITFVRHILRVESHAVQIIITIFVNLLRFALCFYVLGNATFLRLSHKIIVNCPKKRHVNYDLRRANV